MVSHGYVKNTTPNERAKQDESLFVDVWGESFVERETRRKRRKPDPSTRITIRYFCFAMTEESKQTPTEATSASSTTTSSNTISIQEMLPLRMQSVVVRGFGRGSSDLGIPTANLDRDKCHAKSVPLQTTPSLANLPTGIYWGFGRIVGSGGNKTNDRVYTAAISIGYNPTYGNEEKTVEPHLIAPANDPRRHCSSCGETVLQDFYDQPIRLTVVEYLRPELPFEGLEKLIQAIKHDIEQAEKKAATGNDTALKEKEWVASDATV